MKFKQFIFERSERRNSKKHRTVNLEEDLHQFFKKTANHYSISLASLIHNVLTHWKTEFQEEIKDDILKEYRSDR